VAALDKNPMKNRLTINAPRIFVFIIIILRVKVFIARDGE
jgi:hypothetical protein